MTLLHTVLRRVGRGLLAGLVVGIVVGVLSRTMMRVVTLVVDRDPPGFHWTLSLAIVGVLAVLTMIGGVLLALWQWRGRWVAYLVAAGLMLAMHLPEARVVLASDGVFLLTDERRFLLDTVLGVWALALLALVGLVARLTSEPTRRHDRDAATLGP